MMITMSVVSLSRMGVKVELRVILSNLLKEYIFIFMT